MRDGWLLCKLQTEIYVLKNFKRTDRECFKNQITKFYYLSGQIVIPLAKYNRKASTIASNATVIELAVYVSRKNEIATACEDFKRSNQSSATWVWAQSTGYYRDQKLFSMRQQLSGPEGSVETGAWEVRVSTLPRGPADVKASQRTCLIIVIAWINFSMQKFGEIV